MYNYPTNDKTYTFQEVAKELGISEEELIKFAISEGLLDENCLPTQKAIDLGFLTVERTEIINKTR